MKRNGQTDRFFAQASGGTADDLRAKLGALTAQAREIQAKADVEKRALTADESKAIETIFAAFEATEAEIKRREKLDALEARAAAPQRITQPADLATPPPAPAAAAPRATPGIENRGEALPTGQNGFRNMGEFARCVRSAVRGSVDNRLIANAAPTHSGEATDADGGYAVPPDFRAQIIQTIMGEDSLIARTDQQRTASNSITFPMDETAPWSASGVQAYWEAEAAQHTASKIALGQLTVRAHKLAALVPVTDELLEDVGGLASYISKKVTERFTFKINDALLNGTGSGTMLGILQSDALIAVAKEAGQSAGSVTFENIRKMWARMYAPCRQRAVWLVNQDVETLLSTLTFPAASGQLAAPVYMPPGGLSGAPYATLLGRPVISSEACPMAGAVGDISLVDFSQYLTLTKTAGLKQDVSIHLWFDYDITAYRFTLRMGGQPWWSEPMARKAAGNTNTLSPFVTLAARE